VTSSSFVEAQYEKVMQTKILCA